MTTLARRAAARGLYAADGIAALAFVVLARLYFWRLDAYLINDDEGSYLYAAWRISLGELPYRDFLTPQLPAFLMPGGWLMQATGPDVWAARALAVCLTLAAGVVVWATARRLFGPPVAALAGIVFLLQPEVYLHCRTFRSEPFMLFFATLGVYLFARGAFPRPAAQEPPRRPWLALAGLAFGLAMLAKLFGPLALGGCLLWLAVDAWWRRRPLAPVLRDGLALVLSFGLTVALGLGVFAAASGAGTVYTAVLGHHLLQGEAKSLLQVLADGAAFYTTYLRQNNAALLAFVALAVAAMAWSGRERRAMLLACQLPTALLFLLLSREKFPRHLVYLMPALATLFALGVWRLALPTSPWGRAVPAGPRRVGDGGPARDFGVAGTSGGARDPRPAGRWGAWLATALVLAVAVPWWLLDKDHGFRWETGTRRLADFVDLVTGPEDIVLSDYSELDFYALRPTTYAAASLSSGAAGSGQITWERIERELGANPPPLLVIDTAAEFAHLRFLTDRPRFEAWLAEHYGPPVGQLRRDHQTYEIYAPKERPLPLLARFEAGPALIAAAPDRGEVGSGDVIGIRTAWQAPAASEGDLTPIRDDLSMTIRLVDAEGLEWAQADDGLFASDFVSDQRVRPTSRWQAGEITSDRLALAVPPGTPPGTYDLVLGLYGAADPSGLAVSDAAGSPLGRGVRIGQVRVAPWQAPASAVPEGALDLDLRPSAAGHDGPRLLGRGPLPTAPITAGATVPLDLWWSLDPDQPGRAVRLTLSDPASGAIAADWATALPAGGDSGGAIVRQRLAVPILAQAGTGRYMLGITLEDAAGRPIDPAAGTDLGAVDVAARDLSQLLLTPPPVDRAVSARVGTFAELVGADLPAAGAPGEALDVDLVWRALAPSRTPYQATVQLLDASGHPVAQHDGAPAGGTRPTTGWIPEEIVLDRHTLALPADLPRGRYRLITAVYHPLTGARLAVRGAEGGRDAVELGEVLVR